MTNTITRLLIANRGEIARRVVRSAHAMGIGTVAIYADEDRFALHRFKADESYPVRPTSGGPVDRLTNWADSDEAPYGSSGWWYPGIPSVGLPSGGPYIR